MPKATLPRRLARLLLRLLPLLGLALSAQAQQRLFANQILSVSNSINEAAAVDGRNDTHATLIPPAVGGNALLRMGLPATAAAGRPAGAILITDGGLLSLGVLSNLVINTYLAPSTTPQQQVPVASLFNLLTLAALNGGQVTPAEFTATKPFDRIEVVAAGLANVYRVGVVAAYGTAAAPLPVQLVGLVGQAGPGGVALSWQTASELRNAYFEVQRSADGDAFEALGRVAGAGTSAQARHYQFRDAAPLALGYYRLRQVDADGTSSFSPVVAVRASEPATLQAYPSPAAATLTLSCPGGSSLDLYDQQGRLLRRLAAGPQQLDVSTLPAGLYVLHEASTGQRLRFEKAP